MRVVMLGLQSTGKTSYGVGFFAAAKNRSDSDLKVVAVNDPVDTLNKGLELLAQRMPVERTDTESVDPIGLEVELPDGQRHSLQIPDRSGEALRGSLYGRSWHPELLSDLRGADALMVFIRPAKVRPGEPAEAVAELIEGEETDEDHAEPTPWDVTMMPTDAALVDALQEIHEAVGSDSIPVVIVISAWDEVKEMTPHEWLEERVPLVAQYLGCGSPEGAAVYGVSVQGSSFEGNDVDAEVGPNEPDPWDRSTACDGDGNAVELAAPLVWVLETASE